MTYQAVYAEWLDRRVGSWTSQRRYLFNMEAKKPANMVTEFQINSVGALRWQVVWTGQTEGIMELRLEGDLLHRSRDYFGGESHSSRLSMVDANTMVLHTHYGGTIYREEIRLLKGRYALRQTIGFCDTTAETKLVGQYYEELL